MNWDDIKLFLALARRKKLSAAAKDVKMDVTTISRRIKRLEDDLGQTLFERLRTGHVLTANGQELFLLAEQIESNFDGIRRTSLKSSNMPSGTIRISVAEGFGSELLAPILGEFCMDYPDIDIDLVSGSGFLSLSRREADVAIGLSVSKSKHIISDFLKKKLVESGAGLAILPDFIVGNSLKKILPHDISIKRQFWFSCHQSVAPLEKIKALKAFIYSRVGE